MRMRGYHITSVVLLLSFVAVAGLAGLHAVPVARASGPPIVASGAQHARTSTMIADELRPEVTVPMTATVPVTTTAAMTNTAPPAATVPVTPTVPMTVTTAAKARIIIGVRPATFTLVTALSGPGGQIGTVTLTLNPGLGQICYLITLTGVQGLITQADIHLGAPGVAGSTVLPLFSFGTPTGLTTFGGCVFAPSGVINAILANPTAYFVNIDTTVFPTGAVKGQLVL